MTQEKTYICFDFGKKRIGVAVGQTLTRTSSPLCTIEVNKGQPDWDSITKLVNQWRPYALVVGKPLNMDGSGQKMTTASNRFTDQLEERYKLPVFQADERLSSYEARLRKNSGKDLDPVAAQAILETWLFENSGKIDKSDIINQN
ncbi:MAG: Holliday junction resolvase RuvX [Gammaproteobacteria bacterium]|nr:Holliday junction resolvase RuvX [Gammaproteobacteria bacterium]